MRKLIGFLKIARKAKIEISAVDSKINRVFAVVQKQQLDISKKMDQLDDFEEKLVQARGALHASQISNQQLEETISSLREELRTTQEITIPGLVAANELLTRRWEAQTQIEVMKTAAATGHGHE